RAEAHKKRIVDLCVRHKIASKYTSFVVVEKRTGERRAQGQPETRAVPVNAPAGWAMFGKDAARAEAAAMPQSLTQAGTRRYSATASGAAAPAGGKAKIDSHASLGKTAAGPGAPPPPPMAYSPAHA